MQLKYKCSICGELHKNLERHIKENHKSKRFTCLICGFSTNIHYDKTQRMINPFGRKDDPEIVKYRDDIMEAKHQCMIKNNVKIITDLNEINYEDLK